MKLISLRMKTQSCEKLRTSSLLCEGDATFEGLKEQLKTKYGIDFDKKGDGE